MITFNNTKIEENKNNSVRSHIDTIVKGGCDQGICGLCKVKLHKGKIKTFHGDTITEGEILTCISMAMGDIEISA